MQLFKECRLNNVDYQNESNCQLIAATVAEKQLKSHNTINSKNVLQKITTSHKISENESGNCFLLVSILVSCLLKNENLWKNSSLYLTSPRQPLLSPPPTIPSSSALSPTSEWLGRCKLFHSNNYTKRFIYGKFVNTVQVYLTDVIILRKRKEFHYKIYKVFDILKIYLIIYVYKDRGRKFSIYNLSYRTFYHNKIKNRNNNHNKCYLSFCVKKKKIFYYTNVNKRRFHHCCHCCRYCYQHQYQHQLQQHAHTSSIQMNSNGICCRNFLFCKQQFSIYVTTTTETARYFYVYLFKRRFPLRKVNLKLPMKAELFVLLFIFRIDGERIKCLVKYCCVLNKNRNFHKGIEFFSLATRTIASNKLSHNFSIFSISYALLSIKLFINVSIQKVFEYCETFFIFTRISLTVWQAAVASLKRLDNKWCVGYHQHNCCNHHQYHRPSSINACCLDFLNLCQTISNNGNTFDKIYLMETIRKATTNNIVEEIVPKAKHQCKQHTKISKKNNSRNNGNWKNRSNNSSLANKNINKFINKIFSVLLNKKKTDLFNDDIEMDCLCSGRNDGSVGGRGRNIKKSLLAKYNPQNNKFWQIVIITIFMICTPIITASSVHNGNNNMKYSTDIVKTKYGPLRGIMLRANPPVEAFLGVPYATPPLGSLRYMPPVTPSTWKNTRLADRFSPVCPQAPPVPPAGPEALLEVPRERLAQLRRLLPLLANQSEDCLYLNLYVPRNGETGDSEEKSLATIVYIHGESYEWNSGNPYDGSVLAAHGRIIVVTINFRLGVLGFLKTGNKGSAQGNFGLMDLVAGLHWLRENLPAFNGDPNRVTLMGHGTGAALANILVVSPVASDLVHRAILLSGSALSPWAIQKDPLYLKRRVAEHTGCHGDLVEDDIAPCLRTRPISELLSVRLDSPRFLPGFAPFIDGTVLVNPSNSVTSPLTLPVGSAIASTLGIELADFPTRELLFGLTTIESYLDLSAQDLEFGFNETRKDRILRTYVRNIYHYHLNEIYSALKNEYTDWERPPRNLLGSRDAALELLSDGHTAAPLVRLGYLHSLRGGRSYFLHFRHQSGERDFTQRSGSVRGEDVPFCLGLPLSQLFPYNYTKQDIQISRVLVRYLGNFAKNGNPNELTPPTKADISHSYANNLNVVHTDNNNNLNNRNAESHIQTPVTNVNGVNEENMPPAKHKREIIEKQQRKRRTNNLLETDDDNSAVEDEDEEEEEEEEEEGGDDENGYDNRRRNGGKPHDGMEDEDDDYMDQGERETADRERLTNRDRIMDSTKLHVPFWDTYDSINQLYLELGKKAEIRNHYRGHKLSMWLSLIPQLHSPGDSAELSMRHHHFLEENAQFYDGIVRPQSFHRPPIQKVVASPKVTTTTTVHKTESTTIPIATMVTTTECPPNTTIVPTIAATRPQQTNDNSNNSLLKRLANTHYQSYATALTVTIAVGCFLLLLNVFIFAAIYYQREKRATDTKKKEELTEAENLHSSSSPSIDRYQKGSRKSSLQSVSGAAFGEYSCYDDKLQCKEKRALADLCTVELPLQDFKHHSPSLGSHRSSIRRSGTPEVSTCKHTLLHASTQENLVLLPPTYSSYPASISEGTSTTGLVQYRSIINSLHSNSREQCHQSTQSDQPEVHDTGTLATENDKELSPDIPEPPPPPKHAPPTCQAGILRQQGGPQTPSTSKKRVQIQEISV